MKQRKYSLWLYYGLSAAIILSSLVTVAWYASSRFQDFFLQHLRESLESRAMLVNLAAADADIGPESCRLLARSDPSVRVTMVDTRGAVLCDSIADPTTMGNHANRPEIATALSGQTGSSSRFSNTLQTSMLYLAIPRYRDRIQTGVTRTAIPLRSIDELLAELSQQFLLLLLVLLVVISLTMISIYRKVSQPLGEIVKRAQLFATGNFSTPPTRYPIREIAELSNALNSMATQLGKLDTLKREFVASVSHELKTPIATIKSYIETVLDGAEHRPEDVQFFLQVVRKQSDRLAAIVDDLLTLFRLESAANHQILELREHPGCELLQYSADICQARAHEKQIRIRIDCHDELPLRVDFSLMSQAIVNLLDNAIKYSQGHSQITLTLESSPEEVQLVVSDQGPGIPAEHLPRLFDRFYRVDKSRSRRMGGTGLGLSIVKHIAQVHGGRIEVANNSGPGCRFSLILPR